MKYVVLPDERNHPLSFYLAMEDYLAQNMEDDDLLMLWQVEPSVIYGRNQVVENEVNLDYCREHGIRVYQRKSGGGCGCSARTRWQSLTLLAVGGRCSCRV